jgi:hypothetical protein
MPLGVDVRARLGVLESLLEREVFLVELVEREAFLPAFVATIFFDAVFFFDAEVLVVV